VVVPGVTPVTYPVLATIEAIPVLELYHVPPGVASARVVLPPAHTLGEPVIEAGCGFTINGIEVLHPVVARVYVIVVKPAVIPVTTPVPGFMVATDVVLLAHVPPGVGSVSVVVRPVHTLLVPAIAPGSGLITTVVVPVMFAEQPVDGFVATALYVPAVVYNPKSRGEPEPVSVPAGDAPLYNW